MKTIATLLSELSSVLSHDTSPARECAETESEQILQSCFERVTHEVLSRSELLLRSSSPVSSEVIDLAIRVATKRAQGLPLQYLLGFTQFRNHRYWVGPGVLVPRPETELLVELTLEWFKKKNLTPSLGIELGIGSGAISIEILRHFQSLEIWATEVSDEAQNYALQNAALILGDSFGGLSRLQIFKSHSPLEVFEPLSSRASKFQADFLISNPPYLDPKDEIGSDVLAHEPALALFPANRDPLYFYRAIADQAHRFISDTGAIFLETSSERSTETQSLFQERGWQTEVHHDLTSRPRFLIAYGQNSSHRK